MNISQKDYFEDLKLTHILTPSQEKELAFKAMEGDEYAVNLLVESNLRLVIKIAKRYQNRGLDYMDLVEEGNLGLIRAAEKYDPRKGTRFSTYATYWIRQSIERAIMKQSRIVRIPVHKIKTLSKFMRASSEVQQEHSGEIHIQDVADKLHVSLDEALELSSINTESVPLDSPLSENALHTYAEYLSDGEQSDPSVISAQKELAHNMDTWIQNLPPRQRNVIERRYGLHGYSPMSLQEVSEELEISRERVRQLQLNALHKLKRVVRVASVNPNTLFGP